VDVDCIVEQVLTRTDWWQLEEQLRDRGWTPVPSGPICRYRSPSGVLVDLMAHDSLLSRDLEDIVALLDGCRELEERVAAASTELQTWIATALGEILDDRSDREALVAHVPRGGSQSAREQRVLSRVDRLASRAR
jgi:hypothetical protein